MQYFCFIQICDEFKSCARMDISINLISDDVTIRVSDSANGIL